MKRDATDAVFSDLVRERANWTCERCGREFPDGQIRGKARGLHCSHFYGRGTGSLMRHYGNNAFAHCHGCHQYFEARPREFAAWVRDKLGDIEYNRLVRRSGKAHKRNKKEKEALKAHLKKELASLRELRKSGWVGRLEFDDFD